MCPTREAVGSTTIEPQSEGGGAPANGGPAKTEATETGRPKRRPQILLRGERNPHRRWTAEDLAQLRDLAAAGLTAWSIAFRTKRGLGTVRTKARQLRIALARRTGA